MPERRCCNFLPCISQARLAAAACAELLHDAVLSPATCFALLRLADEAAVPCLRRASMQVESHFLLCTRMPSRMSLVRLLWRDAFGRIKQCCQVTVC